MDIESKKERESSSYSYSEEEKGADSSAASNTRKRPRAGGDGGREKTLELWEGLEFGVLISKSYWTRTDKAFVEFAQVLEKPYDLEDDQIKEITRSWVKYLGVPKFDPKSKSKQKQQHAKTKQYLAMAVAIATAKWAGKGIASEAFYSSKSKILDALEEDKDASAFRTWYLDKIESYLQSPRAMADDQKKVLEFARELEDDPERQAKKRAKSEATKSKQIATPKLNIWEDDEGWIKQFMPASLWHKANRAFPSLVEALRAPEDAEGESLFEKLQAWNTFLESITKFKNIKGTDLLRARVLAVKTRDWILYDNSDLRLNMLSIPLEKIQERAASGEKKQLEAFATQLIGMKSWDTRGTLLSEVGKILRGEYQKDGDTDESLRVCHPTIWIQQETGNETLIKGVRCSSADVTVYSRLLNLKTLARSPDASTFPPDEDSRRAGMAAVWLEEYAKRVDNVRIDYGVLSADEDQPGFAIDVLAPGEEEEVQMALPKTWPRQVREKHMSDFLCDAFISEPPVQPLFHQKEMLEYLGSHPDVLWPKKDGEKKGLLLMWKMGSGKTRGAAQIVELLSRQVDEFEGVVVIAQKTNLGNWLNTFRRMPQPPGTFARIIILNRESFEKEFGDHSKRLANFLVVVDESQTYQNATSRMLFGIQLIRDAAQVLCLSGTPIMNDVDDLKGFMLLTLGWSQMKATTWLENYKAEGESRNHAMREFRKACEGRISYFDPAVHTPDIFKRKFPRIQAERVKVTATWMQAIQHQIYELAEFVMPEGKVVHIEGLKNSYSTQTKSVLLTTYDGEEQQSLINELCNKITKSSGEELTFNSREVELADEIYQFSPKIQKLIENIGAVKSKDEARPQVVYCEYVKAGAKLITACLGIQMPGLIVRMIDGSDKTERRSSLVTAFSTRSPPEGCSRPMDVLIITNASSVGTDLLGAGAIHLMTQPENRATQDQTLGRVARYGSHQEGETLTTYTYVLTFENLSIDDMGVDDRDYAINTLKGAVRQNKKTAQLQVEKLTKEQICSGLLLDETPRTYDELLEEKYRTKEKELRPFLEAMQQVSFTTRRTES